LCTPLEARHVYVCKLSGRELWAWEQGGVAKKGGRHVCDLLRR
jgi:hypothetical protein